MLFIERLLKIFKQEDKNMRPVRITKKDLERYGKTHTVSAIAEIYGCSEANIHYFKKKYGLTSKKIRRTNNVTG